MRSRLKNTDFTAFQEREARLSDRLAVHTVPFPHAAARLCTLLDMQTSAGLQRRQASTLAGRILIG